MIDVEDLLETFADLYEQTPRIFSAPGRVNLIGEHTDYNEGFVLPMTIDRRTFVAAAPRSDRKLRVRALDLDEETVVSLDAEPVRRQPWVAYVEGMARVLHDEFGVPLCGSDMAISTELPLGAGLSSSAALEIAAGMAFLSVGNSEINSTQLALAAQRAEHVYAGTKCGIMDQFASVFGQKDHALLIDCRSLEITPIKINLPHHAVVVCNTNVKHELANSAYNERRAECELGVSMLRQKLPHIRALRDVTISEFEEHKDSLPEPIRRRCRHVVTENERTQRAAIALADGNTEAFANLMTQSHESLRDDFEVSCDELDTMVEIAMSHDGVSGARMTGGGFGGCTVNLVRRELVDSFCEYVGNTYRRKTGMTAETYLVTADRGAYEVSERS